MKQTFISATFLHVCYFFFPDIKAPPGIKKIEQHVHILYKRKESPRLIIISLEVKLMLYFTTKKVTARDVEPLGSIQKSTN